jgi:hypothetical protein
MVAVPEAIPVNTPVAEPIVPLDTSLLLHVPPPELVSVVVVPAQMLVRPEIGEGAGLTLTVTAAVEVQPAPLVAVTLYILLPRDAGVITGDAHVVHDRSNAALEPDQPKVEPAALAVKVVLLFMHIVADVDGEMVNDGSGLTVTIDEVWQPDDKA